MSTRTSANILVVRNSNATVPGFDELSRTRMMPVRLNFLPRTETSPTTPCVVLCASHVRGPCYQTNSHVTHAAVVQNNDSLAISPVRACSRRVDPGKTRTSGEQGSGGKRPLGASWRRSATSSKGEWSRQGSVSGARGDVWHSFTDVLFVFPSILFDPTLLIYSIVTSLIPNI